VPRRVPVLPALLNQQLPVRATKGAEERRRQFSEQQAEQKRRLWREGGKQGIR
jgi:hypothetical protein